MVEFSGVRLKFSLSDSFAAFKAKCVNIHTLDLPEWNGFLLANDHQLDNTSRESKS